MKHLNSFLKTLVITGVIIIGIIYQSLETTKLRHDPADIVPPTDLTHYIISNDGLYFYYKSWVPPRPKALIFILHGFAEHIERSGYDYLAKKFYELGYAVFGHDHEGHGRSSGTRGYVNSFDQYSSHAFQVIQQISKDYKGLPIYLFGHSMGGLVTLHMAIDYPGFFKGVMLSSPVVRYFNNDRYSKMIAYFFPKKYWI